MFLFKTHYVVLVVLMMALVVMGVPRKSRKQDSDESDEASSDESDFAGKRGSNVQASKADDFCNILSCGKNHVACRENTLKPAPDCPEETEYNDMETVRDLIVKYHNEKRNLLAGGGVGRLKPAKRMAAMQWDHELHLTATMKAKLCALESDNCHGTKKFQYSGQNIAMYGYSGDEDRLTLEFIVENRLEAWFNESANCTRKIIKSFPQPTDLVGLFTVMVRDKNTHVGCGINRYVQESINKVLLVCHYATNNVIGHPIYEMADEAGSGCKTGTHREYTNLCSFQEKYVFDGN